MKLKTLYGLLLGVVLASCDDANMGNLFYTPCDVNTRFDQSMAYNQDHPIDTLQVNSDDYAFWVCSDLHIEEQLPPYVSQFLQTANDGKAQFIVYNGDLFHGQEAHAEYAAQVLHKESPLPSFYVAGNHDLYFGWELYQSRFGTSTYTAIVQTPSAKDLYIFLESASATLGQRQYEWLQGILAKRGYYRHCFVFTHTNLIYQHITNGVFMRDEAHALYRLFSDHQVSAVFTGHSHVANHETLLGVTYITTGALKDGELVRIQVEQKRLVEEFKQL